MEAIQEMCCKTGVQNEYEFHFNGAKGKYGMARRKKDNAEYGCKDIAEWKKKKKGKEHTLQRFMLSVDLAGSVLVNQLLLLQPSVGCKRDESQLVVSKAAVRTVPFIPSSLEVNT